MYNVAICDDDRIFLDKIKKIIADFCSQHFICQEIFSFSSGLKLIESKELFSILILDIQMPEIGGFEVAEKLATKLSKDETLLIFCTNYDATVYQAFDYQPFHFIRKSNVEKQLPQVLLKAFDILNQDKKIYNFSWDGENFLLQSKEIVCFAIFNKGIRIYTKDKQYRVYGSLKQIEKMVDEKTYIRINKNQIINCEYISEISKNEVKLIDGIKINEKLLIPKGKLKEIKDKFHRFVLSSMR